MKEHLGHDARYDRADEFLEATTGLWDTLGRRRPGPRPRDAPLRRPRQGPRARLRGRVVQRAGTTDGAPVPAGSPGAAPGGLVGPRAGLRGAVGRADLHRGPRPRDRPRPLQGPEGDASARGGRDPMDREDAARWPTRSSASRKAQAEEREQLFLNDLVDPMASLTLLSELMNYDFSGDVARRRRSPTSSSSRCRASAACVQNIRAHIGGDTGHAGRPGRATAPPCCKGRASSEPGQSIADQMEEWFDGGRLRRLRHRRHPLAGGLRGRGSSRRARAPASRDCSARRTRGTTLRDHLGIGRPASARRA